MSVSLADYRAAVTAPGAAVPVLTSAVGRFPVAMFSFATLLYVQRESGSFAVAGAVSAGSLVGVALGSVLQGRLMDRRGPSRVLLAAAALFALGAGGLVAAVQARAPLPVVVAIALCTGLVMPAMPGASRALWERLVPAGPRREAAYGYEAISLEVFFVLGPGVAALLASTPWPGTGTAVAVLATVAGAVGFALSGPVRGSAPLPSTGSSPWGAIASPGMRTTALAGLGFGLVVGAVEVGVPAVATGLGEPWLGGALLSAWSVTSVLVGVLYGMRPWPRALHLRMPVLVAGFGVLVLAMWLAGTAGSLVLLVIAMLAAGGLITPQTTGHSLTVEVVAPRGAATEAFGWVVTAITVGAAVGQSLAGVVVEAAGASGAFLAGGAAGLLVGAVLWARRRTIEGTPSAA
ncbi:MFS transporter [Pseudonocardia kujensis]|uniref:MFS transporter n=1 Tax=Pseudonocardia kujensis TaxID=1128675 RepID=UPI001E3785E5|nr:MFS transporter [Pseudonocardia kujensis]MCE0767261.1 MFS transporter [Pseudonocardia kujensis]